MGSAPGWFAPRCPRETRRLRPRFKHRPRRFSMKLFHEGQNFGVAPKKVDGHNLQLILGGFYITSFSMLHEALALLWDDAPMRSAEWPCHKVWRGNDRNIERTDKYLRRGKSWEVPTKGWHLFLLPLKREQSKTCLHEVTIFLKISMWALSLLRSIWFGGMVKSKERKRKWQSNSCLIGQTNTWDSLLEKKEQHGGYGCPRFYSRAFAGPRTRWMKIMRWRCHSKICSSKTYQDPRWLKGSERKGMTNCQANYVNDHPLQHLWHFETSCHIYICDKTIHHKTYRKTTKAETVETP